MVIAMDQQREYEVTLEPQDGEGFVVRVPELPDVITEGRTRDEALAMAKDAIEGYLESMREEGWPMRGRIGGRACSTTPHPIPRTVRLQEPTPLSEARCRRKNIFRTVSAALAWPVPFLLHSNKGARRRRGRAGDSARLTRATSRPSSLQSSTSERFAEAARPNRDERFRGRRRGQRLARRWSDPISLSAVVAVGAGHETRSAPVSWNCRACWFCV